MFLHSFTVGLVNSSKMYFSMGVLAPLARLSDDLGTLKCQLTLGYLVCNSYSVIQ